MDLASQFVCGKDVRNLTASVLLESMLMHEHSGGSREALHAVESGLPNRTANWKVKHRSERILSVATASSVNLADMLKEIKKTA